MRFQLSSIVVTAPDGWVDITDELPEGSPETLARHDGVGALQFSAGIYKGGSLPGVGMDALEEVLAQFLERQGLCSPSIKRASGIHDIVQADVANSAEFLRIWYISDGSSVVMVSYVTQEVGSRVLSDELHEATSIVESLRIDPLQH